MARVVIAGGGIGGLAAALALSARGHRVDVCERRAEFTELGAGIQLAPNAFHALDRLGVGPAVRASAVFIDDLRLMDGTTDAPINAMPLDEGYRERFGNPYAVMHRTDLYRPLLDACRDSDLVTLHTGTSVSGYVQDEDGVTALLDDGGRFPADAPADVLLGADGIHSAVRAQMLADGGPRVSGHTIYRSVIPMEWVPEALRSHAVTLWAGPDWHFVHYPISGGAFLNLAATKDDGAREAVTGRPMERGHVLGEFAGLSATPRRLLELGEDWRCWVLCDRDPVERWTDGRVALLGDAAHPMLQYAAQGACQALEDAVFLGDLFAPEVADAADAPEVAGVADAAGPGIPALLRDYNTARRDRVVAIQLLSREMGRQVYHTASAPARERNARIALMSAADLHGAVEWLHGSRDFVRVDAGARRAVGAVGAVGVSSGG